MSRLLREPCSTAIRGSAILPRFDRFWRAVAPARPTAPLRLLLIVAVIELLAWAVVTPPLQGPDESAHYSYAQYLAETGHKPQFAAGDGTVSRETGAALNSFNLYALPGRGDARPFWSRAELGSFKNYERTATDADRKNGGGPNALAKNPPLYYAYEAIPYRLTGTPASARAC